MNANMTGFKWFSKNLHPSALDKSSLSIERVNKKLIFAVAMICRGSLLKQDYLVMAAQPITCIRSYPDTGR